MEHIVMYSGGKASWLAAYKVKEAYPEDLIQLVFTDTKTEDEDLYRFLEEGAEALELPLQMAVIFGECLKITGS
jgi:3'-phosphoadenosine 5'-phosphosulfate sulfotransferase (PAPS reductase)/FAD synthetase